MSSIKRVSAESLLSQVKTAMAFGKTNIQLDAEHVQCLLESYLLLATLREHPHAAAILGAVEVDMLERLDPEQYEGEADHRQHAYALLYELIAGEKWSPAEAKNLHRKRKAPKLRVVKT